MKFDSYKNTVRYPQKADFYRYRYSIIDASTFLVLANVVTDTYNVDEKFSELVTSYTNQTQGETEDPITRIDYPSDTIVGMTGRDYDSSKITVMGSQIRFTRKKPTKRSGRTAGIGLSSLIPENEWTRLDDSIFIEAKSYFLKDDYQEAIKAYNRGEGEVTDRFKKDLLEELGVNDHPKADALFSKAWDKGHSSGYSEVYNAALDLVDLITD